MTDKESRIGTIHNIAPGEVVVHIQQKSACTGCHAQQFCCSSDCADRYLRIPTSETSFRLGEEVLIEADNSVGRWAVLLAFVLPIILVVLGLAVGLSWLGWGELQAILLVLILLVIYFAGLYLSDVRLSRVMQLSVRKIN